MSKPFSPLAVLRLLPLKLLHEFCISVRVRIPDVHFETGTKPNALLLALNEIPEVERQVVESALRDVYEMATEDGTVTLVQEAQFRGIELPGEFAQLEGPHARALWFLTHYPSVFDSAKLLYEAAHLSSRYSTDVRIEARIGGLGLETSDLRFFEQSLVAHYSDSEARGRHCHLERLVRGDRLLVFAYLDDYPAIHVGFDEKNELRRRPHRPAFEVVYQLQRSNGRLSIFAPGNLNRRLQLMGLFCNHVLHVEAPHEIMQRPRFQLSPLLSPDITVSPDPSTGILSARIRRLRVYLRDRQQSVTLEASIHGDREEIYRMMAEILPPDRFPQENLEVTLANLSLRHAVVDGPPKTLSFDITNRGSTNLTSKRDALQDIGERLLRCWGIRHG